MATKLKKNSFANMSAKEALEWKGPLNSAQIQQLLENPYSLLRQTLGLAITAVVREETKQLLAVWRNILENYEKLYSEGRATKKETMDFKIFQDITVPKHVFSLMGEIEFYPYKNLQALHNQYDSLVNIIGADKTKFYSFVQTVLTSAVQNSRNRSNKKIAVLENNIQKQQAKLREIHGKIQMLSAILANGNYQEPVMFEGKKYSKDEVKVLVDDLKKESEEIQKNLESDEKKLSEKREFHEKFHNGMERLDKNDFEIMHNNVKDVAREYAAKIAEAKAAEKDDSHIESIEKEQKEVMHRKHAEHLAGKFDLKAVDKLEKYMNKYMVHGEDKIFELLVNKQDEYHYLERKAEALKAKIAIMEKAFGAGPHEANANSIRNNNNHIFPGRR